jgi:hypothetical protein
MEFQWRIFRWRMKFSRILVGRKWREMTGENKIRETGKKGRKILETIVLLKQVDSMRS